MENDLQNARGEKKLEILGRLEALNKEEELHLEKKRGDIALQRAEAAEQDKTKAELDYAAAQADLARKQKDIFELE